MKNMIKKIEELHEVASKLREDADGLTEEAEKLTEKHFGIRNGMVISPISLIKFVSRFLDKRSDGKKAKS